MQNLYRTVFYHLFQASVRGVTNEKHNLFFKLKFSSLFFQNLSLIFFLILYDLFD